LPTVSAAVEEAVRSLHAKPPPPREKLKTPGTAFISYHHRDKAYVDRLIVLLEGRGISVWSDTKISIGSIWSNQLAEQIESAAAVVFVMTGGIPSENVQKEIQLAQQLGKLCMPISLAGATWFDFGILQHERVPDGQKMPSNEFVEQLYEACVRHTLEDRQ
jgi:hypothetical protein